MALIVRPATTADAAGIASVHIEAWRVAYDGVVPATYLNRLNLAERTTLWHAILNGEVEVEGVPKPSDIVAERNDVVVGFADVGRFRDEPGNVTAGELWAMYVSPNEWGQGVGLALMAATIEELRRIGSTNAYLWVLEKNPRARRFYERHGWECDQVTKSFELDGVTVDEIRYSRPISDPG